MSAAPIQVAVAALRDPCCTAASCCCPTQVRSHLAWHGPKDHVGMGQEVGQGPPENPQQSQE